MSIAGKAFIKYVITGTELTDNLKRDIAKDGKLTNKTILKLNEFIIAYNEIADIVSVIADNEDKDKTKH